MYVCVCVPQVGRIFQRFAAPVNGEGAVQNIIDFGVPFFLETRRGVRLTVNARCVATHTRTHTHTHTQKHRNTQMNIISVTSVYVPAWLVRQQAHMGLGVAWMCLRRYEVRSGHRLRLNFESAEVGQLRISEGLEALLAPAMLPRTSIQHQLLLALKQVG